MDFFRRATVALASSPADAGLVRYAEAIAERGAGSIELRFVHVEPDGTPDPVKPGGSPAGCELLYGPRIDKLLEFAAASRSDCIFAGDPHPPGSRRRLTRRLAMQAPCSLWLAPGDKPPPPSRLLAAVDFSVSSAYALELATLLASRLRIAECDAVHVYNASAVAPDEAVFKRFLEPIDVHGVSVRPICEQARSVAAAISGRAASDGADLIVMGARGLSSSSAVLLGAESEQLLIETDRPVLITKPAGDRLELVELLLAS
jgi:nucleotide-binding universal stress UspA family protein